MIVWSTKGDLNAPGWDAGAGLPFTHTDQIVHQQWHLVMRATGGPNERVECAITVNDIKVTSRPTRASPSASGGPPEPRARG
jgi:hypothetical protein